MCKPPPPSSTENQEAQAARRGRDARQRKTNERTMAQTNKGRKEEEAIHARLALIRIRRLASSFGGFLVRTALTPKPVLALLASARVPAGSAPRLACYATYRKVLTGHIRIRIVDIHAPSMDLGCASLIYSQWAIGPGLPISQLRRSLAPLVPSAMQIQNKIDRLIFVT